MATAASYPIRVEAHLDQRLSRWLWLVKWLLAIPHYIVLALPVGGVRRAQRRGVRRHPDHRPLPAADLRLQRRRAALDLAGRATTPTARSAPTATRRSPWTRRPDYPARAARSPTPSTLSRGLVLVKWWLLALPHYVIVGVFVGGAWVAAWRLADRHHAVDLRGGLIGLLVLRRRHRPAVHRPLPARPSSTSCSGMNRWVLRVAAYAALMTDAYPPFRLDMGGGRPGQHAQHPDREPGRPMRQQAPRGPAR